MLAYITQESLEQLNEFWYDKYFVHLINNTVCYGNKIKLEFN